MTIIGLFNNKGGVGKTTLTHHLAHMFALQGHTTLVADLDPQANLTASFLDEKSLEDLWQKPEGAKTFFQIIEPIQEGLGDIRQPEPILLRDQLYLLAGDLRLSSFEDKLSDTWPRCYEQDPAALRATSAFYRAIRQAAKRVQAEIVLMDVGPNLGAINRAALLSTDHLIFPLAADMFSIQGLRNLGPMIRQWRQSWKTIRAQQQTDKIGLPAGSMSALGYVVLQHAIRLDRPVKAYEGYLARIPLEYREAVLAQNPTSTVPYPDPFLLGQIRHYRSLIPLSQETHKPVFELKPADGAFGGHTKLVQTAYEEFALLANRILKALKQSDLPKQDVPHA